MALFLIPHGSFFAPVGSFYYICHLARFISKQTPSPNSNRATEAYMNNLNSVLIEGNMVRDPLIRSTPRGTQVCNFSIASNRFFRQDSNLEKETGFFEVEAWGKLATACGAQGRKGRGVRVVGRLKQDRWTGSDGKSHNKVAIVAEHVEYRPDFKKTDETVSESDNLADAAYFNGDFEPSGDSSVFSDHSDENVDTEELQAVSF
jgi:single-strand DNA-binding protein